MKITDLTNGYDRKIVVEHENEFYFIKLDDISSLSSFAMGHEIWQVSVGFATYRLLITDLTTEQSEKLKQSLVPEFYNDN